MTVFILQNQHKQYLSKDGEWVNSGEADTLFRSPHYDVALNQLIEMNAKDHSLRGAVIACELDSRGRPVHGRGESGAMTDPDGCDSEASAAPAEEFAEPGADPVSEPEINTVPA